MRLPLELRLKRVEHRKVAAAQDLVVQVLYENFPTAVIHGGTAIWRCYAGSRFSEDIDAYLPPKADAATFEAFRESLGRLGLEEKKFKKTRRSVFSRFTLRGTEVRFEAVFADIRDAVVKSFEMVDGTFISVYTLSPEGLLAEKATAYRSRKKVRDLYDIWFLINLVTDNLETIRSMKDFRNGVEEPEDYNDLRTLIIMGAVPSFRDMAEAVGRWAKKNI